MTAPDTAPQAEKLSKTKEERFCEVVERGMMRRATARSADAHKVLVSGSAAIRFQNCWRLFAFKKHPAQKELQRLFYKRGDKELIPLHEENGLYNFYLKRVPSCSGADAASSELR